MAFSLLFLSLVSCLLQSRHGENALIEAVSYRRYDVARALVARRGTEVDVLDSRDRTPLVMAVQYGYAPLVSPTWIGLSKGLHV